MLYDVHITKTVISIRAQRSEMSKRSAKLLTPEMSIRKD